MIFDGVNFNETEVRKMTREEFESRHLNLFWPRRDKTTRRKVLGHVYGLITKQTKKTTK